MQISNEEIKKIRKFLSFKSLSASTPMISPKLVFVPAFGGGVLGRVKLKIPRTRERIDAIRNVFSSDAFFPHASHPIKKHATIQPMVPHTLILENSFSGLFICLNETAFT